MSELMVIVPAVLRVTVARVPPTVSMLLWKARCWSWRVREYRR